VKLDVEDDILRLSVEKHDAPEEDDKTVDSEGTYNNDSNDIKHGYAGT
jgi:hypothetical protein